MCRVKAIFRPQGHSSGSEVRSVSFEMEDARERDESEIRKQAVSEVVRQGILDGDILRKYWLMDKYYIRVSWNHTTPDV